MRTAEASSPMGIAERSKQTDIGICKSDKPSASSEKLQKQHKAKLQRQQTTSNGNKQKQQNGKTLQKSLKATEAANIEKQQKQQNIEKQQNGKSTEVAKTTEVATIAKVVKVAKVIGSVETSERSGTVKVTNPNRLQKTTKQ